MSTTEPGTPLQTLPESLAADLPFGGTPYKVVPHDSGWQIRYEPDGTPFGEPGKHEDKEGFVELCAVLNRVDRRAYARALAEYADFGDLAFSTLSPGVAAGPQGIIRAVPDEEGS